LRRAPLRTRRSNGESRESERLPTRSGTPRWHKSATGTLSGRRSSAKAASGNDELQHLLHPGSREIAPRGAGHRRCALGRRLIGRPG
jgi:hypothetical protein